MHGQRVYRISNPPNFHTLGPKSLHCCWLYTIPVGKSRRANRIFCHLVAARADGVGLLARAKVLHQAPLSVAAATLLRLFQKGDVSIVYDMG